MQEINVILINRKQRDFYFRCASENAEFEFLLKFYDFMTKMQT